VEIEEKSWAKELGDELKKDYMVKLDRYIRTQRALKRPIYPSADHVFQALELTPLNKVRVVLLGQDPYHGPGQAHGLSFSVQKGTEFPPSLKNIFKELADDQGIEPRSGDLTPWANQGVLLLNTVLTVEEGKPNSHRNQGWEKFTDKIIEVVNSKTKGVVFILWGNHAQIKEKNIDLEKHTIIKAPHPSPLSCYRGFFGSRPFTKVNTFLKARGEKAIDWTL
jgi:uracil-DNA glycosylase